MDYYCILLYCTCIVGDDNNDIDVYTSRLESILDKKLRLIKNLQEKLQLFKHHLQEEERVSKKVAGMDR